MVEMIDTEGDLFVIPSEFEVEFEHYCRWYFASLYYSENRPWGGTDFEPYRSTDEGKKLREGNGN